MRGKVWESFAAYLNSLKSPEFRVTARVVRDRFALLISRHKLKQREQEKASGIDVPEPTELNTLLEEIREREKSVDCRYFSFSKAKLCKTLRLIKLFQVKRCVRKVEVFRCIEVVQNNKFIIIDKAIVVIN